MLVNKKKLRKVAATVACLAGMTMFAQAQTPVTIDVSTFSATSTNNSGNYTESQWWYNAPEKRLYLGSANGNYTLTGTNADLCLDVTTGATNANVTFNELNTKGITTAVGCYLNADGVTITLIGNNYLEGSNNTPFVISYGNVNTITSSSSGKLTANGVYGIWCNNSAANLIIDGNANVSVGGTSNVFQNFTGNIKMSNASKFTIANNTSSARVQKFEKLNPTSTFAWKLTNAATADPLTNAVINVSVAAGQTGTVERTSITYNAGDIAVINSIIANNGLNWTTANPADGSYIPADWDDDYCQWTSDVTNKRITYLDISNKTLTGALNVSGLVNLQKLFCVNNNLTTLNVSGLVNLQELYCYGNQLTILNVSQLVNLQKLECNNNQLTTLNVSGCENLQYLYCYYNHLSELDLTGRSFINYTANNQSVSLTMVSNGTNYTATITLNSPANLAAGITYSSGILTSTSNTIASSPFEVQTGGLNGETLSGTLNFTYTGGAGINEIETAEIKIYPNPVKEVLYIDIPFFEKVEYLKNVEIVDLSGKTLMSPLSQINVSHLASGIYFIKITTNKGIVTKKFIKN